jgi:hypothetical protein
VLAMVFSGFDKLKVYPAKCPRAHRHPVFKSTYTPEWRVMITEGGFMINFNFQF